jgi:hypothetical protein
MYSKTFPALIIICLTACQANSSSHSDTTVLSKSTITSASINPYPFISAIPLPQGYHRMASDSNSFAAWLLSRSLKKDKTVYLFNGEPKQNQSAQFAVIDISTGDKNLQQCADAVMRLRAEYLFATTQYTRISFTDNDGTIYQFTPPFTKEHLQNYLPTVFGMCGSASLSKQLNHVALNSIQPGDVLIRGGFPGHAAIVMDVAVNDEGKKIFMLAQSYMPAQDIHVLLNPTNKNLSPWYEVNQDEDIITPEYFFRRNELKRW